MISNSSKYALKAVLYLAVNSNESNKILIKNLSDPINVPQAYIAKLLQELSRHNIVSSTRGPNGGFYLSEANRETQLIDIVNVIDGVNRLNSCLLSLKKCNSEKPCPLHKFVGSFKTDLMKNFENNTIGDMAKDIKLGKSFLPL
ncbi:MAG: Rrf2 family transcriptional regulator [Maribacter sp.]|nr:Rrf2 family transcriptional regulator [Maribacter sp.]NNK18407.1 Rrf2 family transcriptional regulator [Maribacter sp.]